MKNVKRKLTGMLLAATVLSSSIVPTYAATVKYTFTKSGTLYGITTECKGFSGNVTAWARVENGGRKIYRSSRSYSSAKATATLNCTSGKVKRTGGYIQ
ncbi:hypothetical protein [Agathobacter sp.]